MKVLLHVEQTGDVKWHSTTEHFARVPSVGEYVAKTVDAKQQWYEVSIVVHIPSEEPGDFDAEVYARHLDFDAEVASMRAGS
jgi:hypothetical protein